jgi:2-methylfumaryl-CoA hydratase
MKTNPGWVLEGCRRGETIVHAGPLTLSGGERAFSHALDPARHAMHSPDKFARGCGPRAAPLDDLIAFHAVFSTSVPDIRLNAIANWAMPKGAGFPRSGRGPTLCADAVRTASTCPRVCRIWMTWR